MARKKASKKAVKVDFTGVEGKRSTLPDDDYLVEVESVEIKEGQKADYFELTLVVQSGPHKGSKIWDRASMAPNALWRLRSLFEVMGIEVPDGPLEIDPDDLVGCTFIAVTAQEAYKSDDGKKIAVRMVDFYSADEAEDEEDEESDEDEESEEDEEDGEEDEEEEDGEDEEEEEETPEERKKRLRRERRLARNRKKADQEESEEEEDGEDEEEEKPKKKASTKKSTKKPAAKKPAAKKGKGKKKSLVSPDTVMEADEDELEELIEEHGLDVDLDDYKTLRKKQAAVIDALEDADLLEEE